MKILHLTLKRKWWDLIASGEKKEEYREIKLYWVNRFIKRSPHVSYEDYYPEELTQELKNGSDDYKKVIEIFSGKIVNSYDRVQFRLGYSKNAPTVLLKLNSIEIGRGKYEWGGMGISFILKLGEILS